MLIRCKRNFTIKEGFVSIKFKKGQEFEVHVEDINEDKLGWDYIVNGWYKFYIHYMSKDFDDKFEVIGEDVDLESLRDSFRNL